MNLGNPNSNQPDKKQPQNGKPAGSDIDELILRLNNKVAYILGKRKNVQPDFDKTKSSSFFIIISFCLLFLWLSTGVYYIAENKFGLVLTSGRAVNVKRGAAVGLRLPYPFGRVVILDAGTSKLISFKDRSDHTQLILQTKDLYPINIDGNFSYQIKDPQKLYTNYLQHLKNLDDIILWNLQSSAHNLASGLDYKSLKAMKPSELQVLLIDMVNSRLANYGVKVIKANILAINQLKNKQLGLKVSVARTVDASQASESKSIAIQIIEQANEYKTVELQNARENANTFNQLLIKYKQNPKSTVQDMYNKALSQIPIKQPNYSLLNLSLSQLLDLDKTLKESGSIDLERDSTRTVSRVRNLEREMRDGNSHDDSAGSVQE